MPPPPRRRLFRGNFEVSPKNPKWLNSGRNLSGGVFVERPTNCPGLFVLVDFWLAFAHLHPPRHLPRASRQLVTTASTGRLPGPASFIGRPQHSRAQKTQKLGPALQENPAKRGLHLGRPKSMYSLKSSCPSNLRRPHQTHIWVGPVRQKHYQTCFHKKSALILTKIRHLPYESPWQDWKRGHQASNPSANG